jgi:hypothetical protein
VSTLKLGSLGFVQEYSSATRRKNFSKSNRLRAGRGSRRSSRLVSRHGSVQRPPPQDMHRALRPGGDIAALEMLRSCGARIDAVDEKGRTALYIAAAEGQNDVVEWLLSNGADPLCCASHDGRSALHAAAANGQVEACELLLTAVGLAGISKFLAMPDLRGNTAAELAHSARHLDVVRCLLALQRLSERDRLRASSVDMLVLHALTRSSTAAAPQKHAVAQQSWRRLPPSVEIGGMPEDAIFASPQRRFLPEGASPQRAPLFWGGGGSPHAPTP